MQEKAGVKKKRAVAYCRVSTDQEDQLNSLAAQEDYFREMTRRNHYELVHIYADEGITGTKKRNRRAFLQMLKDAGEGSFDVLFVKDISRFARNTLDSLESVRFLKGLDIQIVFVNNQGILETGSEFMFTIMSAMAQEESVNTSKRVKFGKRKNMENGKVPNLVYGYDKIPGELFTLQINEKEAAVVRRMFQKYLFHGEGFLAIAKELNDSGIRTKRGCLWSQNAVARIIKNPIYIGRVVNGREETKEIYSNQRIKKASDKWMICEKEDLKLIPEEWYEQAQELLAKRNDAFHSKRERQSNRYTFSTLIKCRHCGRSFRRLTREYLSGRSVRWVCSSRNGDGVEACRNSTKISEDELLAAIRDYLLSWQRDKRAALQRVKQECLQFYGTDRGEKKTCLTLQKEAEALQKKLERLKEMYLNEIITIEELKQRSETLHGQLHQIEERKRSLEHPEDAGERLEHALTKLFQNMDGILSADTITNEMLRQVIDRIEVDEKGNVDVVIRKRKMDKAK